MPVQYCLVIFDLIRLKPHLAWCLQLLIRIGLRCNASHRQDLAAASSLTGLPVDDLLRSYFESRILGAYKGGRTPPINLFSS